MDWADGILVAVVSWVIFANHVWATRGHFVSEHMELGARLLAGLAIFTALVFSALVVLEAPPPGAIFAGLAIEIFSLGLFWAAIKTSRAARLRFAFDPDPPHGVLASGPYRYVRHPFYTSYILFWVGWAIATWSPVTLPLLAAIIGIYVVAARGEEARFAKSGLGLEYARYRRSTGLFWPKFGAGSVREPS